MKLTFYIIYTSGTVKYLRLFLFSLLKWSDCSFCLVANGCSLEEKRFLRTLCHKNNRLTYLEFPSKTMIKHGDALDYLHSLEHSEYFCFMDSDILATGEFLGEFTPYLDQYTGVFSGFPVWCEDKEQILPATSQDIPGRYNKTVEGVCIGSTYFAIYNNKLLTKVIQSTGISFNSYSWPDIPAQYQSQFVKMDLKKQSYDTGKVLNLLLLAQKESLVFQKSSFLIHIGGLSECLALEHGLHWHYLQQRTVKEKILAWLFGGKFKRTLLELTGIKEPKLPGLEITGDALRLHPKSQNRFVSYRYFIQLLQALFENRSLPTLPEMGSPEVGERVELLTKNIVVLFEEFKGQLAL
jgi:hypothetical protein